MSTSILLMAVALVAQLVDGSLGMGYGVTSTTLLLSVGLAPAVASASVHLAELGTTPASGVSHWRFGIVDALISAGLTVGLWIGRRTPAPGISDAPAPTTTEAPPVGVSA